MGLLLPPAGKAGRTVPHYGFIGGFSAMLETHLDLGLTTAVLCNADPGPALPFRGSGSRCRRTWRSGVALTSGAPAAPAA